jgi:hypothetical protein
MGKELGLVSAPNIHTACGAALWVVHEAKRRYSDVGGITKMVAIPDAGDIDFNPLPSPAETESLLEQMRYVNNMMVVRVLDPLCTDKELRMIIVLVADRLRDIHKQAKDIHDRYYEENRRRFRKRIKRKIKVATKGKSTNKK